MILIGSHDIVELKRFPKFRNLEPCLFSNLTIGKLAQPEKFAESQIFLGAQELLLSGRYSGLVSPRFNERYPKWPTLLKMDGILELANTSLTQRRILSPQAFSCKTKNLKYWFALQDLAHPGMGEILISLHTNSPKKADNYKGSLIMGNTFIMPSILAAEFLNFWLQMIGQINLNDEQNYNYSYRCLKCGVASENGIGRWGSNRQPAYLMERITALASFQLDNLDVCKIKNSQIKSRKLIPINSFTYKVIMLAFHVSVSLRQNLRMKCNHLHFQPGKIG